jgi:hypothetical protein
MKVEASRFRKPRSIEGVVRYQELAFLLYFRVLNAL